MKNYIVTLLIIIFLLLPISATADFKLGVILPLSGDAADAAKACQNGMLLAREFLPVKQKEMFKLIFEDNELSASKAVYAAKKLMSMDKVNALMTWESNSSNAVAPITEEAKIPLFTTSLDPRVVQGRKFAFSYWVTPDTQAKVMMREVKRRGYERIARITSIQDGLLAIKSALDKHINGKLELILDEEYPTNIKDFKPYLSKLKAQGKVDGIAAILMMGQVGLFTKQARELGIKVPIFGTETFENPDEVAVSNGTMVGQWYVQASSAQSWFIEKFTKHFPKSSHYTAANCFDIVNLYVQGIQSKDGLLSFLTNLEGFSGAMGIISSTKDNRFNLDAVVKIVNIKGFQELK